MPGFLGTEKQFQARYGKPILQSRDAKSSSREQEAGAFSSTFDSFFMFCIRSTKLKAYVREIISVILLRKQTDKGSK